MTAYDVVLVATDLKGAVLDETVIYPDLTDRVVAEALLESCMQIPHVEVIAAALREVYPKCLVSSRMRIKP